MAARVAVVVAASTGKVAAGKAAADKAGEAAVSPEAADPVVAAAGSPAVADPVAAAAGKARAVRVVAVAVGVGKVPAAAGVRAAAVAAGLVVRAVEAVEGVVDGPVGRVVGAAAVSPAAGRAVVARAVVARADRQAQGIDRGNWPAGARLRPPVPSSAAAVLPAYALAVYIGSMRGARGRQARLKPEYAKLYPGIKPGVWTPVEKLLRQVTDLIHQDRSRSGIITGHRLLHDNHFEWRGTSARPEGLPSGATRLSDSGAAPQQSPATSSDLGQKGIHE